MSIVPIAPIEQSSVLKSQVYEALRLAISKMDVYSGAEPPRLDERKLADQLGVSRTPVREALSRLEQEGLVENIPRRGSFLVRKSKQEIIEIIQVWAALESMAARLVTQTASDAELRNFKFRWESQVKNATESTSTGGKNSVMVSIDEYSESNISFHEQIMEMAGNRKLLETGRSLFAHMHAIRASTIHQIDRTTRSIIDHGLIIDSLVARRTEIAERLVHDHALELAEHVRINIDYLQ